MSPHYASVFTLSYGLWGCVNPIEHSGRADDDLTRMCGAIHQNIATVQVNMKGSIPR